MTQTKCRNSSARALEESRRKLRNALEVRACNSGRSPDRTCLTRIGLARIIVLHVITC